MLKTTKKGFTIIEVVIVLVIGAVIMLGVFLVVPGLQRSAQNQRRQDIARQILAVTEQFKANNQGAFPTAEAQIAGQIDVRTLNDPNGTLTSINVTAGAPNPVTLVNAAVRNNTQCNGQIFGTASPGKTAVVIALATPTTGAAGTPITTYCISN